MNDDTNAPLESNGVPIQVEDLVPTPQESAKFLQRTDWVSFGLATVLVFVGYILTLAPDVTLGKSGIYSTGAMYAGVSHPTGYPVWTLYSWLVTKLLPFSNIAWRVGVSTALTGALACGLIALMVSRGGVLMIDGIPGFKRLVPKEENLLRVVCGCIAGMAFGFDRAFWDVAVIVDVWPFTILLFALTICLLMRWVYSPNCKRFLYAACFVYGLTLTNSEALLTAIFGLQIFIMFGDREVGREIFFTNSLLLFLLIVLESWGYPIFEDTIAANLTELYTSIAILSALICLTLTVRTRRLLTRWKTALMCCLLGLLALSAYFYLPLASMTNPPVNWGYPRTVEGFFHVINREQYERPFCVSSFYRSMELMPMSVSIAASEFGSYNLVLVLIPLCLLYKMRASERKWMLGLLAVFLCLSFLMIVLLNPPRELTAQGVLKTYFTASHLILAIWTGCGLILLGSAALGAKPSVPAQS